MLFCSSYKNRSFVHDSRQPLTAISLAVRILMLRNLDTSIHEYIATIEHQVSYLTDLISSLESDGNDTEIDIRTMIEKCLESIKPIATSKQITIVNNLKSIPFTVRGNLVNVQRVVMNLLSNAIKYNYQGCVSIDSSCEEGNTKCWVVIRVSDTGYGIPEKYHQKIFEPDFRVPEHTNKANGTGLGLFICKQLIENQGGFLELESSEVAVGSTFALKLPIL